MVKQQAIDLISSLSDSVSWSDIMYHMNLRCGEDMTFAERLLEAERARLLGVKDLTLDEVDAGLSEAIERGAAAAYDESV